MALLLIALGAPGAAAHAQAGVDPAPTEAVGPPAPYLTQFPLASLSQTRDRPLFAPTRRPPAAPPPPALAALPPPMAAPPPPPRPPQVTLLGFVRSQARGPTAVVMDNANRKSLSLRAGDEVQGWVVQSVEDRGVVLRDGDNAVTITFPATALPGAPVPSNDD